MSNRTHATKLWLSAATIALIGSSLALPQAFGQAPQLPTNGAPSASSANISDQKLKEAATAIPHVEGIRQNFQQQLAQAPDGDKQRIQNQAGDEMKKAISDQGLSISEYNSILQIAERNPEIRARLIQQMPDTDQAPGP
jgi:hypothetical protein